MIKWGVSFQVYRNLTTFPYPQHLAEEIHDSTAYHCEGQFRQKYKNMLFVYTLNGRGVFRRKGKEYDLTSGKAFLCFHNDPEVAWYYPKNGVLPWNLLWLSFQGSTAKEMLKDLIKRYGSVYNIPKESSIIKKLIGFQQYGKPLYPMAPQGGAELIFHLLTSLSTFSESEQLENNNTFLIKNAQEMILADIEKNVSVNEISKKLKISREHFSRIFKEETGMTPGEFIISQKMHKASHLLKDTSLSCKEIADRLGYLKATNFSRAFKSTSGLTPREFRVNGSFSI
jgi:AraC-like DNA-binding protein